MPLLFHDALVLLKIITQLFLQYANDIILYIDYILEKQAGILHN